MFLRSGRKRSALGNFVRGVEASFPIVLGYLPVAVAFGISAAGAGMSTGESVLVSALIFAGASQFSFVGLIGAGTPIAIATVTSLALNLRHILYGPLVARFLSRPRLHHALPLAFGLTDEVFATALVRLEKIDSSARMFWLLGLEAGAYLSWVAGTFAGAAGGELLLLASPSFAPLMSFALPALFAALLLPLLRGDTLYAAVTGAAIALTAFLLGFTAMGVLFAGILGPLFAIAVRRR